MGCEGSEERGSAGRQGGLLRQDLDKESRHGGAEMREVAVNVSTQYTGKSDTKIWGAETFLGGKCRGSGKWKER